MGRRRTAKNRSLPPNLYERKGYFAWRDPRDGKEYGLGKDKRSAIEQAIEANLLASGQYSPHRLIDRLTGAADRTFADWYDRYMVIMEKRELKPKSIQSVKDLLRAPLKKWGITPLEQITVLAVGELIKTWTDQGKLRMATHVKSRLSDFFREAIAAGWIQTNPAEVTKIHGLKTKRERLPLTAFKAILEKAKQDTRRPWAYSALKLALITGQRREDLAKAKPEDVNDGYFHVIQEKTGMRLRLPLDLRLDDLKQTLGEVISECLNSGVKEPEYLIHHRQFAHRVRPGQRLRAELLTRAFADHRDTAEVGGEDNPPTFHEIRSLSGRLYANIYGQEFAQAILGHRTASTTATYLDLRGSEWATVTRPDNRVFRENIGKDSEEKTETQV